MNNASNTTLYEGAQLVAVSTNGGVTNVRGTKVGKNESTIAVQQSPKLQDMGHNWSGAYVSAGHHSHANIENSTVGDNGKLVCLSNGTEEEIEAAIKLANEAINRK